MRIPGAAEGGPRPGVDGLFHRPDEFAPRVRVVRRIDDVEAADEVGDAARLGPGRGDRQQDAVPERDVGRRGAGLELAQVLVLGNGDGRVRERRASDLAEVELEHDGLEAELAGRPFRHPDLDAVPLAVIEGQREDPVVSFQRPIQGRRGIDASGEQDDAGFHGF